MDSFRLPGVVAGQDERLRPETRLECGVCWHVYDPAEGDATWDIPPGTAFADLPDHWRCPQCDNERSVFLPLAAPDSTNMESHVAQLLAAFHDAARRMNDLPVYNPALAVEVVGFQPYDSVYIGILITPWCMNVVLLPQNRTAWDHMMPSAEKQTWALPCGQVDFEVGRLDGLGTYQACSLFSPMQDFPDQTLARDTASAALAEMMTPEAHQEALPEEPTEPSSEPPQAVNRRDLLRGKLR